MGAGPGVGSSIVKSCGTDVEDVLKVELEGPVDDPGTTMGTYLPCSIVFSDIATKKNLWFLSTGPLVGVSVIFADFSKRWNCWRILEDLYCHE